MAANLGRRKLRLLLELFVRVGLLVLFIDLERRTPFIRVVHPEEAWQYRNPVTVSYVPGYWLWRMVAGVPLVTILATYAMTRDSADLTTALLVVTLSTPLNGVVTDVIKLAVGRPRPDFIYRCWSDGVIPSNGLLNHPPACTGNAEAIVEGRKSFPSGHSSYSFATWGFVFFYLSGKLGTFQCSGPPAPTHHLLLLLSTILVPLTVALSRVADYHHHWQDVLVGSVLGWSIIWVVYRQHYPSISSPKSHLPLAALSAQTLQTDKKIIV